CAAITGGYVALRLALQKLLDEGAIETMPLNGSVAAVSVGMVGGRALCDLDYGEDSNAEVDAKVVMTGDGGLVEVQATGERTPLSRASLDELLGLAEMGISRLRQVQERVAGTGGGSSPRAISTSCARCANCGPGWSWSRCRRGSSCRRRMERASLRSPSTRRAQRTRRPPRPRSPTTPASGPWRSVGARASTRPATAERARATRRTWKSCCARWPWPAASGAPTTSARWRWWNSTVPSTSSRPAVRAT